MRLKDIGVPEVNRHELAAFIDALDITEQQRSRIRREALIEDVPFELSEDAPTQDHT